MRTLPAALLLALVAGCTSHEPLLADPTFATGSRTLVAAERGDALFNVNVDEGTISRVTFQSTSVETLAVGLEPTRIARAGDRLFVTLRGERAVAVVVDGPGGLDLIEKIPVGAEPFGVVANEAGTRVYVAVSLEGRVVAIDTRTLEIVKSWPVEKEPRWLALHPSGGTLVVASARGGQVTSIDVGDGDTSDGDDTVDVHPLPGTERTTFQGVFDLTPRLMGDPAFDPQGLNLVIPAIYVDNNSLQDNPTGVDPTQFYYANPKPGLGRFNAALVQVPTTRAGRIQARDARPIFLSGFKDDYTVGVRVVRSYPNSVSVSPDGLHYAASMEASDAVVVVGALDYDRGAAGASGFWMAPAPEDDPTLHGFADHPAATIDVGHGPRGVAFLGDDRAWVHTFMDLRVSDLQVRPALDKVANRGLKGLSDTDSDSNAYAESLEVERSVLPSQVREGRRLFMSATANGMVAASSGVSCHTCHTDGRDDGLTWQLGPDARQTPSLAGRVSETHPVTWTGNVADVATEASLTSTIRMGGAGMGSYEPIAAYIDWVREIDRPDVGADAALVEQGRAIFERADVGCASCHTGPALTDNRHHDMYGLVQVNTPTLRGIAATAPYLHDGRAETLRDVLESARNGSMGNTSTLSSQEMDALEAYLKSL